MSHLMPQRHWGLWMRMHEPLGLSLRAQFVVHFWANWHMLLQWRDLVTSSLFALIPTAAMALALWHEVTHGACSWASGASGSRAADGGQPFTTCFASSRPHSGQ